MLSSTAHWKANGRIHRLAGECAAITEKLWLDATYIKVRRSGRIVSVAAIVAVAVNLPSRQIVLRTIACRVIDGRREVLGIAVQPSEAEVFWDEFLRSLADRGLRGTRLIIAPLGHARHALPGNG